MIKIDTATYERDEKMYKTLLSSKKLVFLCFITTITSCSTILAPDKEFTEPMSGSIIIAQNIFKKDKPASCDSKPKKERLACQKQVDALAKSISDAKEKSNQLETKKD